MSTSAKAVELRKAVVAAANELAYAKDSNRDQLAKRYDAANTALDDYVARLERIEAAAKRVNEWLSSGDGKFAQHRDAALQGHAIELRAALDALTPSCAGGDKP